MPTRPDAGIDPANVMEQLSFPRMPKPFHVLSTVIREFGVFLLTRKLVISVVEGSCFAMSEKISAKCADVTKDL